MKYLLLLCPCLIVFSCSSIKTADAYKVDKHKYDGKYADFLDADEVELESGFHFVKSKKADSIYILRTFFPETKQITAFEHYKDDSFKTLHGEARYWYDNGFSKENYMYVDGVLHGPCTRCRWETGQKWREGNYVNGYEEGRWLRYDQAGWLLSESLYVHGKQEGLSVWYDSLQNVVYSLMYEADTVSQVVQELKVEIPEMQSGDRIALPKECVDAQDANRCYLDNYLAYIYQRSRIRKRSKLVQKVGIRGETVTHYTIECDGSISDIVVIEGLCQEFVDEIHDLLAKMPAYEPAIKNGKKAKSTGTLNVLFQ